MDVCTFLPLSPISLYCKILNFVFSCCLNIPANRLWAPLPGDQAYQVIRLAPATRGFLFALPWTWPSNIQKHQWHTSCLFLCILPPPLIKALACGLVFTLCSPPAWLSPLPGLQHMWTFVACRNSVFLGPVSIINFVSSCYSPVSPLMAAPDWPSPKRT